MFEYKALVRRVVDGDTVDFTVDLGFGIFHDIRARYSGVNTPERGHEDFHRASRENNQLLIGVAEPDYRGYWVKIRTSKTGKYGRWLVEIAGVTDVLAKTWPY